MSQKAIVLLSGGLDSTTTLYFAKKKYDCRALIFDYGQRHRKEVRTAVAIAKAAKVPYQIVNFALPWKGSSLLDSSSRLPSGRSLKSIGKGIPSTYVPGRNTIFLSFAVSYAEAIGAKAVFIGANAIDFSGYPDCRPAYYKAMQKAVSLGTKAGGIRIVTPLINMTKSQIIKLGRRLRAPLEKTWSCYMGGKEPCGVCDSCVLRRKGFEEAR